MRLLFPLWSLLPLTALALVVAPRAARSQTKPVECTATVKADWTVSIAEKGGFTVLSDTAVGTLLGAAECTCNTMDLVLDANRVTAPYAQGTTNVAYEVWAGSNCNVINGRENTCEEITPSGASIGDYWSSSTNVPREPIPVRKVITPATTTETEPGKCVQQSGNGLWLLFYDNAMTPGTPNHCRVLLPSKIAGPAPVEGLSAGAGDRAVNLSWSLSTSGEAPASIQVLCADAAGNPLPQFGAYAQGESKSGKLELAYSTCLNGGTIQRRPLPSPAGTTLGDGGTTNTPDMAVAVVGEGEPLGTESEPLGPLAEPVDPLDAGVADDTGVVRQGLQVPDGGFPDHSKIEGTQGAGPFVNFDKRYVCSPKLAGTAVSARISGLENDKRYYFAVLTVDSFGNPSAITEAQIQDAAPQPVEDLYRRFKSLGGKEQGFCFIATAAYGSYQHPFVEVLRDFRDQALLATETGRAFVDWYYRTSPPYADWIAERAWARFVVRLALWPVIGLAAFVVRLAAWQQGLVLVALLALAAIALRRRSSRRSEASSGAVGGVA